MKRLYPLISWIAVVAWMAAIFTSSSYPVPEKVSQTPDKLLHFGAYLVLGLLYVNALTRGFQKPTTIMTILMAAAFSTLFGATDEWHQAYVPARSPSGIDVLFDFLGSMTAGVCTLVFRKSG